MKKSAKIIAALLMTVFAACLGVMPAMADSEPYLAYMDGSSWKMELQSDPSQSIMVYCLDREALQPTSDSGVGPYTLTTDPTDEELISATPLTDEEKAETIRRIVYFGYPNLGGNDGEAWKAEAEELSSGMYELNTDGLRGYTQS
ncbi:MAG: thioester domain-containing protein, partial [Oscillospiraceae bacterium]